MWFYLALLSALFNSLTDIARRTHGSLAQPAELAWWTMLFSLPLGLGLVLIENEPIHITFEFLLPALAAVLLGVYGGVFHFKAYKYSDASAAAPISNLLPVALIITSFLLLGIVPSVAGFTGILLVVAGVYYSSVSGRHGLFYPFRQLMRNKGSRAMLAWVGLMAFTVVFMQMALKYSSPSFTMFFTTICQFFVMSGYLLMQKRRRRLKRGEQVLKRWGWHLAAIAVFGTMAVFFQLQAMELADPSYVLSVKRLDVVITVLLAGLFLRERHILKRFKGSAIALVGVVIIFISS